MKTKPTKGPWKAIKGTDGEPDRWSVLTEKGWWLATVENGAPGDFLDKEANARLIAAAGTAATSCEDLGYDGAKCVEKLPAILKALTTLIEKPHMTDRTYDKCVEIQQAAVALRESLKNDPQIRNQTTLA